MPSRTSTWCHAGAVLKMSCSIHANMLGKLGPSHPFRQQAAEMILDGDLVNNGGDERYDELHDKRIGNGDDQGAAQEEDAQEHVERPYASDASSAKAARVAQVCKRTLAASAGRSARVSGSSQATRVVHPTAVRYLPMRIDPLPHGRTAR